jgi:tRNA(Ile)-lysidine synthase
MTAYKQQFISRFEDFLTSRGLLTRGAHVALAVSGGVDSMTMLNVFAELRERWDFILRIVHLNHQLRGEESNGDEEFVRHKSEALGLPFCCTRVDTIGFAHEEGVGKQEAARELRYRYFEDIRQKINAEVVATAHNADDNAETVLMNALRGSGVHGLAGIPLRREQGAIIRPMLFAYRHDIEQYVEEVGIEFREDSSNASQQYTRNFMRLNVIPYLDASLGADTARSLNRISDIMREVNHRLSTETEPVYSQIVSREGNTTIVNIPRLLGQSPLVQDEILLAVFRALHIEPHAEKLFNLHELCSGQTGRSLSLSATVTVYRDRERLIFGQPVHIEPFELHIDVGKHYALRNFEFTTEPMQSMPNTFQRTGSQEFVDSQRLSKNLILRNWKAGDWFIPLGLHSKKKLSDFFIDAKVPRFEKQNIPVLESDGNIVWVCGYRLDERFMVMPETTSVVKLQYVTRSNVSLSMDRS